MCTLPEETKPLAEDFVIAIPSAEEIEQYHPTNSQKKAEQHQTYRMCESENVERLAILKIFEENYNAYNKYLVRALKMYFARRTCNGPPIVIVSSKKESQTAESSTFNVLEIRKILRDKHLSNNNKINQILDMLY